MKEGNKVVLGIFDSRLEVENAVDALKVDGFRNSDISVLMPQEDQSFGHEKASKAPEASTIGGGTGALIGGALGWLVGLGAIATVPMLGPLVAAGPIMAALSGAAVGGALGGVAGALVGFGIPEYEAKRYESFVKEGGILLSVHADDADWAKKAKDLLERLGAHDISSTTEEGSDVNRNTPRSGPTVYAP
jgi:hypothetical protein